MEKKTGEIGALQHFKPRYIQGLLEAEWKRIPRHSMETVRPTDGPKLRGKGCRSWGVKGNASCSPDGRKGVDVAVPARLRFSCGKGDGGRRFGWETPPCGQRHMRSQGGAVYFPNHSAERGIRQEAPFFRL